MFEDLHGITEVKTLKNDEQINHHLKQGWVILQIYTTCYDPELYREHQTAHVLLGRPNGVPEYVYPEDPYAEYNQAKIAEFLARSTNTNEGESDDDI